MGGGERVRVEGGFQKIVRDWVGWEVGGGRR